MTRVLRSRVNKLEMCVVRNLYQDHLLSSRVGTCLVFDEIGRELRSMRQLIQLFAVNDSKSIKRGDASSSNMTLQKLGEIKCQIFMHSMKILLIMEK